MQKRLDYARQIHEQMPALQPQRPDQCQPVIFIYFFSSIYTQTKKYSALLLTLSPSATLASTSPVAGFTVAKVLPDLASTNSLLMKSYPK